MAQNRSDMTDLTSPFTLTRWEVALASAEEYIRTLWWILISIPLFGLVALVWGPNELIRGLGGVCLIWPLTIPIRAVTASARAGGVYGRSTVLAFDDQWIYLVGSAGKGSKIARSEIWTVRKGRGIWRLRTRRLSIILVPSSAILAEFSGQLQFLLEK